MLLPPFSVKLAWPARRSDEGYGATAIDKFLLLLGCWRVIGRITKLLLTYGEAAFSSWPLTVSLVEADGGIYCVSISCFLCYVAAS